MLCVSVDQKKRSLFAHMPYDSRSRNRSVQRSDATTAPLVRLQRYRAKEHRED